MTKSSFTMKSLACIVPCLILLSAMKNAAGEDESVAHVDLIVHENHVEIYLASSREIAGSALEGML